MTFREALRSTYSQNYGTFQGCASRSEFWYLMLFFCLAFLACGAAFYFLTEVLGFFRGRSSTFLFLLLLFSSMIFGFLVVFVPFLTQAVRRFHDVGLSGWWYLASVGASYIPTVLTSYSSVLVSPLVASIYGALISLAVFVVLLWPSAAGVNKFGESAYEHSDVE